MSDLGRDNQVTVFQFLFDYLIGNQLAAFEVPGKLAGDLEYDLLLLLAHPDSVFLFQSLLNLRIVGKSGIKLAQPCDFGKGEGLKLFAVARDEIPDPLEVD